jgi:hypothetical protein
VANVRRQTGYGAVEVIAAAGVPLHIHFLDLLFGCSPTATDRADRTTCFWKLLFSRVFRASRELISLGKSPAIGGEAGAGTGFLKQRAFDLGGG